MPKVRRSRQRRPLATLFREGWRARGDLGWALDVLRYGVCGECSLGTHGWRDELLGGMTFCSARMENLRRWTVGALDPAALEDVSALTELTPAELRSLGRLPEPFLWRNGQPGFQAVSWEDALKLASSRLQAAEGRWKVGFNPSELSNEAMFCLSELASSGRASAVNSPLSEAQDASSRLLRDVLGTDLASCGLEDLAAAEVVLVLGCDLTQEPLLVEHLDAVERRGGQVHQLPCAMPALPDGGDGVVLLVGPQVGDPQNSDSPELSRKLRYLGAELREVDFIPVGWPPGYRGALDLGLVDTLASESTGTACALYLQLGSSVQQLEPGSELRIHQIVDLDSSVLAPAEEGVLLLPMQSRFEMEGGGTYTSLVGHVRFSPEIRGHQIGSARPDWWVLSRLLSRIERNSYFFEDGDAVRRSLAQLRPIYSRVSGLFAGGEGFQSHPRDQVSLESPSEEEA